MTVRNIGRKIVNIPNKKGCEMILPGAEKSGFTMDEVTTPGVMALEKMGFVKILGTKADNAARKAAIKKMQEAAVEVDPDEEIDEETVEEEIEETPKATKSGKKTGKKTAASEE